MKTDAKNNRLPEFIQDRLNFFVRDLIQSNNNGKHLVLGKRPSQGDIVLQSNDYLSLANHPLIRARLKKAIDDT
ncbi:MAG: CAI-1 autoinducer synthase, partial [Vibrio fluvialis]